jgi:hypothetical protein
MVKPQPEPKQYAIRLDPALSQAVDAWRAHLNAERPGAKVSISDAVRTLIAMAVELPEVKKATRA